MDNIEILSNPESTLISILAPRLVVESTATEEDGSGEENSEEAQATEEKKDAES